jgi:hypothetical protein
MAKEGAAVTAQGRVSESVDIDKPGILREFGHGGQCGRSGKGPLVISAPETAFSIDMDPVQLLPNKLITYSTGSRALRQPERERSPKNII